MPIGLVWGHFQICDTFHFFIHAIYHTYAATMEGTLPCIQAFKNSPPADETYGLSPNWKVGPSKKRIGPKIPSTSLRTSSCSTGGKLDRRRVINPVTFSLPLCHKSYFIQLGFLFLSRSSFLFLLFSLSSSFLLCF